VVLHKPVSPSTLHDAVMRVLIPDGATPAPRQSVDLRFAAGQRVLLVEDNAINREVARELLGLAGLEVAEAFNGLEALRRLDADPPYDAVLMDVQMPELDGVETVQAMRAEPRWRDLPVIAMTAHAMLGDRERFLEAGMSDYVAKPIEETQLLGVLSRWLRLAGAPAAAARRHGGVEATSRFASEPALRPRGTAGSEWLAGSDGSRDGTPPTAAPVSLPAELPGGLPAALPGVDVATGLRRVSGNAALYTRLLRELAAESAGTAARLGSEVAAGRHAEVLGLLHTLKGSAATLGADGVAAAAAALELQARQSGVAGVDLGRLTTALAELTTSVAQLPAAAAADGAAPPAAGEAPHAALAPLVTRLRELLPLNDLAALETFQDLAQTLGPRGGEPLAALGDALDRLDFAGAERHLERLAAALLPSPEAS
jgi:two-component system sensor histidine kinase/response regulator